MAKSASAMVRAAAALSVAGLAPAAPAAAQSRDKPFHLVIDWRCDSTSDSNQPCGPSTDVVNILPDGRIFTFDVTRPCEGETDGTRNGFEMVIGRRFTGTVRCIGDPLDATLRYETTAALRGDTLSYRTAARVAGTIRANGQAVEGRTASDGTITLAGATCRAREVKRVQLSGTWGRIDVRTTHSAARCTVKAGLRG